MFLIRHILDLLRRHSDTDGAEDFADALRRLDRPSEVTVTPADAVAKARQMLRGALGSRAAAAHPNWFWPYWMVRQIDPESPAYNPLGPILANTTRRNWTVIGNPAGPRAALVDPCGAVMPWENGWTLETWLRVNGHLVSPARLPDEAVTQCFDSQAPAVETRFTLGLLRVALRSEMLRSDDQSLIVQSASVCNGDETDCAVDLIFAIRPWNPEGISLLRTLAYNSKGFWLAGENLMLYLPQRPDYALASGRARGDVALHIAKGLDETQVHCEAGLATGASGFRLRIGPGATAERFAVMPASPLNPRFFAFHEFTPSSVRAMRAATRDDWQAEIAAGMSVALPDARWQACFDASRAHLLARAGVRQLEHAPLGEGGIRLSRATSVARALDAAGHHARATDVLRALTALQWQNGYFCGRLGEWDANGRVITALAEHWRLSGDRRFLEDIFRAAERGAVWIEKKRHDITITPRKPRGLLPAGFPPEEGAPNDFFYCDNFWSLRAMQDSADMARDLDRYAEHDLLAAAAAAYARDIAEAVNRDVEHRADRLLGAAPNRPFSPLARANLCALYPLQLYSPTAAPWLEAALREAATAPPAPSGLQPAQNLRTAHCLLLAGQATALRAAEEVLALASPTFCWPSAVHPRTGGGCAGDGHDLCASAEWLLFLRGLLLREEGETLVITPLLPGAWFAPGSRISVSRAPTHFGVVDFSISCDEAGASLHLSGRWRTPPAAIRWHSPAGSLSLAVESSAICARADCGAPRAFSL